MVTVKLPSSSRPARLAHPRRRKKDLRRPLLAPKRDPLLQGLAAAPRAGGPVDFTVRYIIYKLYRPFFTIKYAKFSGLRRCKVQVYHLVNQIFLSFGGCLRL